MGTGSEFAAACHVVRTLRAKGHTALLAGGCVRDLLLGRSPHDFDVATSAEPGVVLDLFPRTFAVGAHFGVVLVETSAEPRTVVEVATFRTDGSYTDGRRPEGVRYAQSPAEDAERRDFTINGMFVDPLAEGLDPERPETIRRAVLDTVGGLADLDAGVVRAIGQAETRFREDHLRMLRAVRFAARLGFRMDEATAEAIRAQAGRVAQVSRERVRDELTRMLTEGQARRAFELLDQTELLPVVLPEVARMKGVEQPPEFHPEGDVWTHTLGLLEQLRAGCTMTLGWSALLHDVGKPATFERRDRIRFNGHAEVGAVMAADVAARFRFSRDETALIVSEVANHMRFGDVAGMKLSTFKRFLQLPEFDEHLELHRMDATASGGRLRHWETVVERRAALPPEEVRPKPLVTGRDLIALGHEPGPQFKQLLQAAEDAQLEGRVRTREEALALLESASAL